MSNKFNGLCEWVRDVRQKAGFAAILRGTITFVFVHRRNGAIACMDNLARTKLLALDQSCGLGMDRAMGAQRLG